MKGALQQAYSLIPPENRRQLLEQIRASFVEVATKSAGDLDIEEDNKPIRQPWIVQVARASKLDKVLEDYPQFKETLFNVAPLQRYRYKVSFPEIEINGWPIRRLTRENFRGLPFAYWQHVVMPILEPTKGSNP